MPGWQVWADRAPRELPRGPVRARPGQEGRGHRAGAVRLLPRLPHRPRHHFHFEPVPDSEVEFAKQWGMKVEVEDRRKVVEGAERRGGNVVLGGHSLGGSITTAYATWDFNGQPGAKGLSGLVYIDGGSGPTPISPDQAQTCARRPPEAGTRGSPSAASRRRSPASSTTSARRARPRPNGLGRAAELAAAARQPEASRCRRRTRPRRLRARHQDLAARPAAAQAHLGPAGRERQPAGLGPRGCDHAGQALREDVLRRRPREPRRDRLVPPVAALRSTRAPSPPGTPTRPSRCSTSTRPTAPTSRSGCGSTPSARLAGRRASSTAAKRSPRSRGIPHRNLKLVDRQLDLRAQRPEQRSAQGERVPQAVDPVPETDQPASRRRREEEEVARLSQPPPGARWSARCRRRRWRRGGCCRSPRAAGSRPPGRCACRRCRSRRWSRSRGSSPGVRDLAVGDVDRARDVRARRTRRGRGHPGRADRHPPPARRGPRDRSARSPRTGQPSARQAVMPPSRYPPTSSSRRRRAARPPPARSPRSPQPRSAGLRIEDHARHLGGEPRLVGGGADALRGCGPRRTARSSSRRPPPRRRRSRTSTACGVGTGSANRSSIERAAIESDDVLDVGRRRRERPRASSTNSPSSLKPRARL